MVNLLRAIEQIIRRHVIAETLVGDPLDFLGDSDQRDSLPAGTTELPLTKSTRRYKKGDFVAIYMRTNVAKTFAEKREITCVKQNSLIIDQPLESTYYYPTYIQKTHYGSFLDGIYIGNPAGSLPGYPAITLEMVQKDNEPLTLESTTEDHQVLITVYSMANDTESGYESMLSYAKETELALWRIRQPLVEPYEFGILAKPIQPEDRYIKVDENLQLLPNHVIILEDDYRTTYHRIEERLGNNVYKLFNSVGYAYESFTSVFRPQRHFYDCRPLNISFGNATDNGTPLNFCSIRYVAKEEKRRFGGYADPLAH